MNSSRNVEKIRELGVCDHCGALIPRARWYTSRGTPRRYCSIDCRNTANSRVGAPIRSKKARERVQCGIWYNPRSELSAEEKARLNSIAARKGRLREVREGRWRNPALNDKARRKLSRPRKHRGILARVIDKLDRGLSVNELSADEQRAHRRYRKQLRDARIDAARAYRREYDRRRWQNMSKSERDKQRAKWREQNKRRSK